MFFSQENMVKVKLKVSPDFLLLKSSKFPILLFSQQL